MAREVVGVSVLIGFGAYVTDAGFSKENGDEIDDGIMQTCPVRIFCQVHGVFYAIAKLVHNDIVSIGLIMPDRIAKMQQTRMRYSKIVLDS